MLAPVDHACVGCFDEDTHKPDLASEPPIVITNAEACLAHCSRRGWSYAGIHNENICTCGDTFLKYGAAPMEACSLKCSEQQSSLTDRGGPKANSVYKVGPTQLKLLTSLPLPSPSAPPSHVMTVSSSKDPRPRRKIMQPGLP
ncbi:hypothetical protein BGZ59_003264 [Podila verticillata]|nr:hypothetical protein BGZ59_003264 [Podila verticillata]